MRSVPVRLAFACALASGLVLTLSLHQAYAVATRVFELDDAASLGAGELVRSAVHSDGRVTVGVDVRRIAMDAEVASAWSHAVGSDGSLYVGTGSAGKIYRLQGDALSLYAETGQLLVSALALGEGGVLYAGTLPEGRIFAIAPDRTVRELVRPTNAEHVWALTWDPRRRVLFAATGPECKVFAITTAGAAELFWDGSATHVMSLALAPDGTLYAGTDGDALVVAIRAPGRAEVVHDFPGNEITALAFRDGVLAVAANEFETPPALTGSSASTKHSASATRPARPRPGKGRVWTVAADGRAERVWSQDDGHVTSLGIVPGGVVFAGLGEGGRIVRIAPDRTSAVWIDVDERQVLGFEMEGPHPFFTTGDGAAIYRVLGDRPHEVYWHSKVLDAEWRARWGALDWRGEGRFAFQTRSGNTERPDDTWSAWSSAMSTAGPVRSPAARFLQLRAQFLEPSSTLRAVNAFYLPQNQRPVVLEVSQRRPRRGASTPASGSGTASTTTPENSDAPPSPSPTINLTFRIDNPDSDRVRYRLRFREESQTEWRDMLREHETLSATEYAWNTSSLPDGRYIIEVEASDELGNPESLALRSRALSEPILVDNHAPRIENLRFEGQRVRGRVIDSLGPIARLEYAIDGGEFRLFFPADDLLDTRDESFELDVSLAGSGSHIVAIKASDSGGNAVTSEIEVGRARR